MKRADKKHLKRVITVLLTASMLVGTSQVPQMPPVTVVAWADDDIDLLNADADEGTIIGDITVEDLLQSDTAGGITEEDVLQSDTAGDTDTDDIKTEDLIQEGPIRSTETLRGLRNDRSGPQNTAGTTLNDVSYIDENGVGQIRSSATALSESMTELTPGWYVVNEDIVLHHSVSMNKQGDYHIILANNKEMRIGSDENNGIEDGVGFGCLYDNSNKERIKLYIYAQSKDSNAGQLNIYDSSASPDGRPENEIVGDAINVDELTINGGKIIFNAGGSRSHGINTNKLTVNGGNIVAFGTIHAINSTGTIVMNNGSLMATAGAHEGNCGINSGGDITINGGTIEATATEENSHGISSAGDITINGGFVIAAAGVEFKTDEVSGGCGLSAGGNITISGNVTANAYGRDCHGISSSGNIIIKDGNVIATTKGEFGHALYSPHNITIDGGTIEAHTYFDNANAIFCDYTVTVNGGSIRSLTEKDSASGIKADSVTINDGEVYAEAKKAEEPHDNFGIRSGRRITINGGRVTAKGMSGGIHSQYSGDDGSALLLSWKNETDIVCANSILLNTNQNVAIEPGKTFKTSVNGQDHYYVAANASKVKELKDFKLTATSDTVYAVNFDCGEYGTVPPLQILKEGSTVTEPDDPKEGTKYNGLDFAGWYQDESYQIRYDFDSRVTADLYLHAKWAERSTDMKDASVKMIYRYTGDTIEPVVENNIGNTLTKDTDYTVSCKKDGSDTAVSMKDPGFYNIKVTGKNTYSGSKTVRVCVLTFDAYDPASGTLKHNVTLPEGKDAAIVTASTVSMNTGWYVVTESVTVNSRMKVNGDVHLILCDGVTLDAGGDAGNRGISVTEGNSLTIYSQEGNSGKLDASTRKVNYYAAIGGDCPANYIKNNDQNNINNNNGNFSYLNGNENGNAGNITIHGGEIIAKGSMYSAAIGKAGKDGVDGKGGKITIYGGKITAERFTSYGDISSQSDTAIGGPGAEIHLSHCREDDYILSEGYQGTLNFDRAFIIEDTSTLVKPENINDSLGKKILPVDSFNVCTVTFDSNGGTPVKAQTIAMGKLATMPATPIKRGYKFVGWYTERSYDEQFKFDFTCRPVDIDLTLYAKWVEVDPISYIGADGQISGYKAYSLMQADYTELPAGSYYVDQTITLPDRVKVTGTVNLILGDGYTLTVPWGISVMGDNTLNIFCQSGGTGRLIANAAGENAAIGGDSTGDSPSGSSGNINIYGGYIDAQGGTDAASIGGGKNNQNYGTIRIYGGTINSLSGKYAAAIGGGQISATKNAEKVTDGTIGIYGGTVTVSANAEGTGIGGGKHSYGGNIDILGGKVKVTVSPNNAELPSYSGIGDGYLYEGAEKAQITLGCQNNDDFIYSEQYYGNVRVAPYQTLQLVGDDSTKFYGEISEPNGMIRKKTLKLSHTHELTFSVNGSTITASCSDSGCELHNNPAVLTLHAPSEQDIVYDSNEWPAIVTDERGISGYAPVYYQKKSGNSWGEKVTSAPEDVGTYLASITLSDEKTNSTATVSVEYTIIKREVTISGLTADDKVYDDSTAAKINDTAIKLENMADGDDVHIVSGNASFDSADAGTNKTVTFRGYYLGGTAAGNYNLLSQPASVTADIEKRPVNIKADDQTVQIGEAIEEMAASCEQGTDTGILTGRDHAIKVLTLTPDPDPRSTATLPENGTIPGTITPSGAVIKRGDADVTGNYDITYQNGSLEITLPRAKVTKLPAARVNLKYQGFEKEQWLLVYPGEAETKMEYKVEQVSEGNGELLKNSDGTYVLNNEAPTEGYEDAFSAWKAGSYHVWYRSASANDLLPGVPGCINVNIATAPLTVRVPDASISYGDEFPALTPVVNGFVTPEEHAHIGTVKLEYLSGGEWKNAEGAATQGTYPAPGTYPLSVSYNGDGEVTSCYDVTYVSGNLTVEPRTVILNWADTSLIYNGSPQVPAVTLLNLASNEDPASVAVCMAGQQVNAGQNYTATAAVLTGTNANKYKLPSDNTKAFSIAKSNDAGNIQNVEINVPLSATSFTFTASVAGKMPRDAGELTYNTIRTVSTNGFTHENGGIAANVDQNGLVTVTINRDIQNNIDPGDKLFVCADVDSTNYNTKSITVEATFVSKADAGVRITQGNEYSVSYDEALREITLSAVPTISNAGGQGTWTWESSNPEVAKINNSNSNSSSDGNCTFNILSVGTSRISVKYESSTAIGYADLILTVNPVYVSVPGAKTGLVYTGSDISGIENYDDNVLIVTGATERYPGDYVATVALNEPEKFRWEDGTTNVKYIPWRIDKANGPAAPTGLTGIAPTTGDNIDGKISGVKNTMEYSTNESFTGAIRCTNTDILGLTPGYYYVRVRETETAKAGAAVKVEVKACPVPVVKARQGLVYNGSSQVLAESDTASNGKLYYAVIKKGDPEPVDGQYTLSSPTATNAGSYYVWYKTSLNDKASCVEAMIGKKPATVMLSASDKDYDGTTEAKLTITVDGVCTGDNIVIKGLSGNFADKNVGSAKNVSIDSSRKIILGAENYELSAVPGSTQAAITKRNFSNSDGAVVIRAIPVQYYTGNEVCPEPVVKCFGTTFEKNVDYTVSYTANTAMGTASVTVTGIYNCEGSITKDFEIGLPEFGTVTVVNPGNKNFGTALGAAPEVTATASLVGETVTVYYSSSRAGIGTVWDPSKADLNAGTYYVWAEVAEKTGDGGHAAAKSDLVSFKVNKVPYGTLSQDILPSQAASYDVTVALPAGAKNTEYEYVIKADSAGEPAADSNDWAVLPVLTNGKFTATGLDANTSYKIWLRRKADANHTASAAIHKTFTTPENVILSYDLNGGSGTVPDAEEYTKGVNVGALDDGSGLSRYGYHFAGWKKTPDGSSALTGGFKIDTSTILYAHWLANQYTVSFQANGGQGIMADQIFTYGIPKDLRKSNFSRSGYTFAGWATSAGGEAVYKDEQNVKNLTSKGTITLYAVWVDESFTVSGEVKEGEDEDNSSPVQGISVTLMRGDTVFGSAQNTGVDGRYSFSGVPAGLYNLIATRTLNGKPQKVTALVEVKSGNVNMSAIVMPDKNISSEIDVKDDTPAVMVGGLDAVAAENAEGSKEVTVTMTVQTKDETNAEGADEIRQMVEANTPENEEVEIDYLDVSIEKQTVSSGSSETEAITKTNKVIELIIPFSFAGKKNFQMLRFHEGEAKAFRKLGSRPADPVDGTCYEDHVNSRIFAYSRLFSTFAVSYETSTGYMITYRKNDGTSDQYIQEIAVNTAMSATLTPNTFSRGGYSFSGWNTEANGEGISYTDGQNISLTSDLVLYAQWKQNSSGGGDSGGGGGGDTPGDETSYAVTVINGTGTGSYKAGSSVEIRADEPEEGKRFKEWEGADDLIFTTGSKTTANAIFTMPEREVSLKAIYEELPAEVYTVTVTDDGHGIGSAYPDYGKSGTKVTLVAQPSAGYKFKEWQVVSGNIIITEDSFIIGEENVVVRAVFEEDKDHTHEYTSVVTKEPTCTETGIKTFTCECGDSYTEEIPALGHDYAGEITLDPTTEADGEKTYTCKRCGHSYKEAIPKLSDSLLLYEKVKSSYEIRVSKKLVVGKGFTLVPKFASGKVVNECVVWESTNPDVATVTQDGKVKAMSGGETTVFVRSEENPELTAYCIITVTEPVTEIILDKSRVSFGSGEKAALTAELLPYTAQQKLVWSTANASVVILCDEKGDELPGTVNGKQKIYNETGSKTVYVKAVGAGSAKVTAMAADGSGKKSSCSFSVGNPVPTFSIHGKGKATEVKAGKTLAMQIEWDGAKPKNTDVTWYVSGVDGNNPVFTASISDKGVLTGITAGKVKVFAVSKANPERTAGAEITVSASEKGKNPEITAISLSNADEIKNRGLNIGKSYTLKTLLETSGTGKAGSDAVAWISSDSNVVTVSQKGVVKAIAPGKVTIIAVPRYAADLSTAPKDSVTFSVYAPVKKLKLDKTKLTVGTQTGSTYGKIGIAAVTPAEATNPAIRWTADNDNVQLAAVLKDGSAAKGSFAPAGESVITDAGYALAVKAIAPGVTKLTGITMDGSKKKVTCKVTVRGEVTGVKLLSSEVRMKAGSSMTIKPIIDINGISGSSTDKTDKNKYRTYKRYTDTSVSYRSSDTSVLTVNKNGKVKVNKNASGRSAIVYAASADGRYKAEMKITVD